MVVVVVLGLGAAIVYGTSDFFGAVAARRIHLVTATAFNYGVATVGILIGLLFIGGTWSSDAVWSGTVSGVIAVFGLLAFYGVLAIGPMSVLSPLIALIQSVVPVTFAAITGQPLTPLAWIAIVLAVVAIILVAPRPTSGTARVSARGALLAVLSGILLGASLVTLHFAPNDSGIVPAVLEIVSGLVVLVIAIAALRLAPKNSLAFLSPPPGDALSTPASRAWLAAAASGLLTAVADAFIVIDLHIGNLAVVSVLTALYPVMTVILATTVLHEKITKLQVVGIALVILASLLLSVS